MYFDDDIKIYRGLSSLHENEYKDYDDDDEYDEEDDEYEEDEFEEEKKTKVEQVFDEIEENRNHSWFHELYERNKNQLDKIALIYRNNKITYEEMFKKMENYAEALRVLDVDKNSEIPVCMSNTPELVYLLGAASLIGAKVNIFGGKYQKDYVNEIIKGCNSKVMFIEDNYYRELAGAIANTQIKQIVMTSTRDSLKDNVDPIDFLDLKTGLFTNKVNFYKTINPRIADIKEFEAKKEYCLDTIDNKADLDTEFTITYTSGSTNEARPKAIIHTNRSFITAARFHDKDLNGGYSLKNFTFLAHIPPYSNTNLISAISDALMQGGTLALEPVYNQDFFINSLLLYQPHYVAATKSFWVATAKKIFYDKKYDGTELRNMFIALSCGEPLEINEEKFINQAFKEAKAGTRVTHTPFSIVKLSEAAGDCEHGSIFYTLFRAMKNKNPRNIIRNEASGLKAFDYVEFAVLDENGEFTKPYELGRVVADSPCTMKGYKNNEEATKKFFIKDALGQTWGDMNVYGYIDKKYLVHIKGRIPSEKEELPPFLLAHEILKDRKNILSCEVVKDPETENYVCHIELNPETYADDELILYQSDDRIEKYKNIVEKDIYYRIRNNQASFPLTGSGKRDVQALKKEGMNKALRVGLNEKGEKILIPYGEDKKRTLKLKTK